MYFQRLDQIVAKLKIENNKSKPNKEVINKYIEDIETLKSEILTVYPFLTNF